MYARCPLSTSLILAQRLFTEQEVRLKLRDSPSLTMFAPRRMRILVNTIIAGILLGLLATPIFSMYRISSRGTDRAAYASMGIFIVFTVLFASTLAVLTHAKRHELFAATAAYCAVLVVFIRSTNQ